MALEHGAAGQRRGSTITKEVLIGLLAILLGGYNLLSQFGFIAWKLAVPQILANVLLVIAGIILWLTAWRLWRYRWHSRGLF